LDLRQKARKFHLKGRGIQRTRPGPSLLRVWLSARMNAYVPTARYGEHGTNQKLVSCKTVSPTLVSNVCLSKAARAGVLYLFIERIKHPPVMLERQKNSHTEPQDQTERDSSQKQRSIRLLKKSVPSNKNGKTCNRKPRPIAEGPSRCGRAR